MGSSEATVQLSSDFTVVDMKLRVFRTLWGVLAETDGDKAGSPVLQLEDALKEISRLGYDGVELPLKCILHLGKERFKLLSVMKATLESQMCLSQLVTKT